MITVMTISFDIEGGRFVIRSSTEAVKHFFDLYTTYE